MGRSGASYADPDYWSSDAWVTADFLCEEVAPGAYLWQYAPRRGRLTRRLTVWRQTGDGWQIAYHQGTHVEPD